MVTAVTEAENPKAAAIKMVDAWKASNEIRVRKILVMQEGQMIKGAIFDIDGTILDSMYVWEQAGELFLLILNCGRA